MLFGVMITRQDAENTCFFFLNNKTIDILSTLKKINITQPFERTMGTFDLGAS